jgi:shikimate 5-dehydrogenase
VAVPWDARQETTVDWIINATSVSPAMDWFPAAPARGYCDLRYGSQCTEALQAARARGLAVVSDGLGMLVRQAAGSFELWTGVKPDRALVERVLSLCSRG